MRVAVIGGGTSSEHEVSLRSAASVAAGLRSAGHETVEVTIDRDGGWAANGQTVEFSPGGGLLDCEVVFPVLHGPGGEDGSVQGLLEVLDVPYAGSDVESSAICMDKLVFKDLLSQHDIPQVDYCRAGEGAWRQIAAGFGQPVWVKPARLGSSVGISPASGEAELDRAVEKARRHDPRVIIEAPAPGKEVECSLLGNEDPVASPPGEIVTKASDWYDYEAKYAEGGMELRVPAEVAESAGERVRELARRVFALCGCSGLARCDFFVDGDDVLVNELNTIPGFTETSVYGKL
ncbi:MAG TPA: D-alanine--D-alanine ligase family protein, partial [Solirubrobacterales bacterium]|nr:D-alanine--D-alanine ligase family protein [Solirubrobacterales bacterium]